MLFHIHSFIGQSKYLKSQGISNLRLASRAVRGEPVFPYLSPPLPAPTLLQNSLKFFFFFIFFFFKRKKKHKNGGGFAPRRGGARGGGGEPVFPYLSALRAAESVGKIPESLILVPRGGLAPTPHF